MKIGGVLVDGPNEAVLVLPHRGANLVLRAQAIPDMTEFHLMCPKPIPPKILTKDGPKEDTDNEHYVSQMINFAQKRTAYLVVKSLECSDIEWDTVDPLNPSTWARWDEDFRNAGLNEIQIQRIIDLVMEANSLDDEKIKWARDQVFAVGQQEPKPE